MKIDSHQHFWQFDPVRDSWINDEMQVIRRSFLPGDVAGILTDNGVDGAVAVQADQSEKENDFLLDLAVNNSFIKGIVGWVDFKADNVAERLAYYSQFKIIKGFRYILQAETNRALMLEPAFKHGIGLLQQYGFTYDILIFPDQLKYAAELAAAYPAQKFVLDHIAKPPIKSGEHTQWAADLTLLAQNQNVWCKLSGMVTEADWSTWKPEDIKPYLDTVIAAFGVERCMFGSDWPVCLLAADYKQVKELVEAYAGQFTVAEREKLFGGNAVEFYNL